MKSNYTYEQLLDGNILVKENGEEMYTIFTNPYHESIDDLDFECDEDEEEEWTDDEEMIFYDGFAVNTSHTMVWTFKTIEQLKKMPNPNWEEMDMYDDGEINLYQIYYWTAGKEIHGKDEVKKYLESKRNTIKNKIKKIAKDNPNEENTVFLDDGKDDTLFNDELNGWINYIKFIQGSDMIVCLVDTKDRGESNTKEIRSSHLKAEDWATILPKAYASVIPA